MIESRRNAMQTKMLYERIVCLFISSRIDVPSRNYCFMLFIDCIIRFNSYSSCEYLYFTCCDIISQNINKPVLVDFDKKREKNLSVNCQREAEIFFRVR